MSNNQNDSDRAELRKKRRKKERIQALAIMGGAAVVALLIVVLLISGLVRVFTSGQKKQQQNAEAVQSDTQVAEEKPEKKEETKKPEKKPEQKEDKEASKPEKPEKEEQSQSVSENSDENTDEVASDASEEDEKPLLTVSDEELDAAAAESVASLSLEQKVAKLFIITPGQLIGTEVEPKEVGSQFYEKIGQYPISGILLKKANIGNADEFSFMLSNMQQMIGSDTLLVVDDEGGEDSPFVAAGLTENVISSEHEIGESLGNAGAYSAGISIGGELKNYGIDLNLAPYIDVSQSVGSAASVNGFGKDAATNAELGKNMIRGMKDQGIMCAVKTFPGYGDVSGDGSNGKLSSNRSREQLIEESKPYQECIKTGADMVMISHVGFPKIRGDQRPASLSEEIITGIVREEWGYDGVVITDYMDKSCIFTNYTYADAAVSAIEAGADIILSTKNFAKSYDGIIEAVKSGKLSEERIDESVKRIIKLKRKYRDSKQ